MSQLHVHGVDGPLELVTAIEIAGMLGPSRRRVNQMKTTTGFPKPLGYLGKRAVWDRRDIDEWAKRRDRRST